MQPIVHARRVARQQRRRDARRKGEFHEVGILHHRVEQYLRRTFIGARVVKLQVVLHLRMRVADLAVDEFSAGGDLAQRADRIVVEQLDELEHLKLPIGRGSAGRQGLYSARRALQPMRSLRRSHGHDRALPAPAVRGEGRGCSHVRAPSNIGA